MKYLNDFVVVMIGACLIGIALGLVVWFAVHTVRFLESSF